MRKSNVVKMLGIVMAAVILGMVPASTAKADYTIHQEGFCLELEAPKGAILMENSYGEKVAYDANGNAIAKITASGYKIDYEYDVNGNQTKVVENKYAGEPWGQTTTVYDAQNRPVYEYDAFGDMVAEYTYQDNVVTKTSKSFPYDTWTYTYDKEGRMIQYDQGTESTYKYTYDEKGNIVKLVESNIYGYEIIVDLTYDEHNNITTVHKHGNEGTEEYLVYTNVYDELGRLVSCTNGVDYSCTFTY